jgi:ABC-type dipeptide/oligopeptide/nickel transport system permease subunit
MTKKDVSLRVALIATLTLSAILISMVIVMLSGLYNEKIDNSEIFKAITPAFQMVVGAFVGLVAGLKLGETEDE